MTLWRRGAGADGGSGGGAGGERGGGEGAEGLRALGRAARLTQTVYTGSGRGASWGVAGGWWGVLRREQPGCGRPRQRAAGLSWLATERWTGGAWLVVSRFRRCRRGGRGGRGRRRSPGGGPRCGPCGRSGPGCPCAGRPGLRRCGTGQSGRPAGGPGRRLGNPCASRGFPRGLRREGRGGHDAFRTNAPRSARRKWRLQPGLRQVLPTGLAPGLWPRSWRPIWPRSKPGNGFTLAAGATGRDWTAGGDRSWHVSGQAAVSRRLGSLRPGMRPWMTPSRRAVRSASDWMSWRRR